MKTLKDTIDGMLSDDWKERLIAETEQCDLRMFSLERHMEKIGQDSPEYSLLEEQLDSMRSYFKTLMARLTVFGIEYSSPTLSERMKTDCCCYAFDPSIFDSPDVSSAFFAGFLLGGLRNL